MLAHSSTVIIPLPPLNNIICCPKDIKDFKIIKKLLIFTSVGGPIITRKKGLKNIGIYNGIFYDRAQDRKRHKFVCPVKGSKKFSKDHPYCPWFHSKFTEGSGCYRYLRVDSDIRSSIDYDSESFKRDFNKRSSSERVFSKLLSILMQKPSVIGLAATANLCTISHITVLAVAYFSSFVKELR